VDTKSIIAAGYCKPILACSLISFLESPEAMTQMKRAKMLLKGKRLVAYLIAANRA